LPELGKIDEKESENSGSKKAEIKEFQFEFR